MLLSLSLNNVGPSPALEMEFAPRLNLITGDNGLGKSFLLDVAWWALTRRWPHDINSKMTSGYAARPSDRSLKATISFVIESKIKKKIAYESVYNAREQAWIGRVGRPLNPGLVIYAHADGGFSVWDPARNYWKATPKGDVQERIPAFVFSSNEVWDGLDFEVSGKQTIVCNGLLRDWASWIRERGQNAQLMTSVLHDLAPESEPFEPGPLVRLSVNDARDIPSIKTAYHGAVPVLYASSGVRRVIGLAYMLLWSWSEHLRASEQIGDPMSMRVTLLIDEIESHLHPRWQRSILKSLLNIMGRLHGGASVQLIGATHSPLILASAEPSFDPNIDAWFDLDFVRDTGLVTLERRPFIRQGTAGRWLTSEAFDLKSEGRSIDAEQAIEAAGKFLRNTEDGGVVDREAFNRIDDQLRRTLPELDRFWIRWSRATEDIGIER